MKRNGKTAAAILLILIATIWVVDKIPFKMELDRQIESTIYMDGKFAGKTTVTLKGEKTRYLFRDDSFVGEIRIACLEKTGSEGLQANVQWRGNEMLQSLSFYFRGDFLSAETYGLSPSIIMKEDMRNFALTTLDGRGIFTLHGYCSILNEAMGA